MSQLTCRHQCSVPAYLPASAATFTQQGLAGRTCRPRITQLSRSVLARCTDTHLYVSLYLSSRTCRVRSSRFSRSALARCSRRRMMRSYCFAFTYTCSVRSHNDESHQPDRIGTTASPKRSSILGLSQRVFLHTFSSGSFSSPPGSAPPRWPYVASSAAASACHVRRGPAGFGNVKGIEACIPVTMHPSQEFQQPEATL